MGGHREKTMKTTRSDDLEKLDASRSKAKQIETRMRREATLVAVYEMSKDAYLEGLRKKLIEALKKGDLAEVDNIKNKVQAYASSPTYKANIAKKIARQVNEQEAERFYRR
jgi:hypothetical protein